MLQFLSSFFAPRTAKVIVQGSLSKPVSISNQVYQGTVLGPPSWNVFFADVASSVIEVGFSEDLFADDLACEKYFPVAVHEGIIFDELRKCQSSVHAWGASNRVRFDPLKEEFKIIHNTRGVGDSFKYLGAIFDTKLKMDIEIDRIYGKSKAKIRAILRTKGFYSVADLIHQFKTHVWPFLEGTIGGIFHACDSQLIRLDNLQDHFLEKLEVSRCDAFLNFNFAPLAIRRRISVLGLLFKVTTEKCHPGFREIFQSSPVSVYRSSHNFRKALHDY